MLTVGARGSAMRARRALSVLLAAVALSGCPASWKAPPAGVSAAAQAPPTPYALDLEPVSSLADPCVDFEAFACGGRSPTFTVLKRSGDLFAARDEGILRFADEVIAGRHQGKAGVSPALRDYLTRCRDPVARAAGGAELRGELDGIANAATFEEWARALGHLRSVGLRILVEVLPVVSEPSVMALRLGLAEPVLPLRFYKPTLHWTVHENQAHWERLAKLSGMGTAEDAANAARVDRWLALARPDRSAQQSRAAAPLSRADLEHRRFPWSAYFEGLGNDVAGPFSLADPGDLNRVDSLTALPLPILKNYVRILMIEKWSEVLSWEVMAEEVEYHHGTVHGLRTRVMPLRFACSFIEAPDFAEHLLYAYLETLAERADEGNAGALFGELRDRLRARILRVSGVSGQTRAQILASLDRAKLSFIDDWTSPPAWSPVTPDSGSLLSLYRGVQAEATRRQMTAIGHPWKAPDWPTWPLAAASASVDTGTDVVWLAPELLCPPYLRGPPWPTASYGGLGAILGHELGHILPDDWRLITSAGRAAGTSAATRPGGEPAFECLSRHLARMAVDGDLMFGGRSTSEEYTSDLIGADLALETMRADLAAHGGGADPESYWQHTREFFVAFAQHFCSTGPDYTSELQARSDPHPSVRLRVNGVVSEMPEFTRAFSCATGQPMAPAERCLAW